MNVSVKTGTRRHRVPDRYGVMGDRIQHVAEVWIGGRCFTQDCATPEEARAVVLATTYELGLK